MLHRSLRVHPFVLGGALGHGTARILTEQSICTANLPMYFAKAHPLEPYFKQPAVGAFAITG